MCLGQTLLSRADRSTDLLDQSCAFTDILKLLFYILEDLGWVVFAIEYPGHDLHVAVRNVALIPQFL